MGSIADWHENYYQDLTCILADGIAHICLDRYNRRIRLDAYTCSDHIALDAVDQAAQTISAEKIIAKIPTVSLDFWIAKGYVVEGKWDSYFSGKDGYGVSRFLTPERRHHPNWHQEDQLLDTINKRPLKSLNDLHNRPRSRVCGTQDAEKLAAVYRDVFSVYPTPVHDPAYIRYRIMQGALIRAIENDHEEIISAATVERYMPLQNGEVTDCVTRSEARGRGHVRQLIAELEQDCIQEGLILLYALSRAGIAAINITLSDLGYQYRGRFANNCRMDQGYENMNLWLKKLR